MQYSLPLVFFYFCGANPLAFFLIIKYNKNTVKFTLERNVIMKKILALALMFTLLLSACDEDDSKSESATTNQDTTLKTVAVTTVSEDEEILYEFTLNGTTYAKTKPQLKVFFEGRYKTYQEGKSKYEYYVTADKYAEANYKVSSLEKTVSEYNSVAETFSSFWEEGYFDENALPQKLEYLEIVIRGE